MKNALMLLAWSLALRAFPSIFDVITVLRSIRLFKILRRGSGS